VVTLALAYDNRRHVRQVDRPNWQARLEGQQCAVHLDDRLLVRKGNPKGIKDWDDTGQAGSLGDYANPKTSAEPVEQPRRLGYALRKNWATPRRTSARPRNGLQAKKASPEDLARADQKARAW